MEIKFAKRMDRFEQGIFQLLDEKKAALEAAGKKTYNLSVGTPDMPPAPHVMRAMLEAAAKPEMYKYALRDLPELISAVRGWYKRRYGVALEADEITSVYGSQEGFAHIALPLCDPGDIMLVPNPGYPAFEWGPFLCGARLEKYTLDEYNGYLPDLDSIPESLARAAKVMVVSYPSNPVCAAAPEEFYPRLISFAQKYNIIIIHDNAYSEIIFDGRVGGSFLRFPGAKEVGVEFNSLSKTYNLTGARISFLLGNREIVQKLKLVRSQIDYGIFYPVQHAAIAALNGPQDSVLQNRAEYEARRNALCGGFRRIGWNVPDSQGSMFVWTPLPEGRSSSYEFCFELLDATGLIVTPGAAFGSLGEGHVRMALVKPVPEIEEIIETVRKSGFLK